MHPATEKSRLWRNSSEWTIGSRLHMPSNRYLIWCFCTLANGLLYHISENLSCFSLSHSLATPHSRFTENRQVSNKTSIEYFMSCDQLLRSYIIFIYARNKNVVGEWSLVHMLPEKDSDQHIS